MYTAIIPARIGSKRITNKNIKKFLNKPIIYYSIKAALKTKIFKRIIVSTDSKKIQLISKKAGATCPFLRPKNLSGDKIGTAPVIDHCIKKLDIKDKYICCIYPTAPMIKFQDIKNALKLIKKFKSDSCYSITKFDFPIQRALSLKKNKKVKFIQSLNKNKRSQDLKAIYHDAAQFYWLETKAFKKNKTLYPSKSVGFELPNFRVQDIDNMNDWKIATAKFKAIKK